MAGVKSLLGAAAKDIEQTTKAQAKPKAPSASNNQSVVKDNVKEKKEVITEPKIIDEKPKNKGGRPPISADEKRHQYTLTLTGANREKYMAFTKTKIAKKIGADTFSRLAELAMDEYILNHGNEDV